MRAAHCFNSHLNKHQSSSQLLGLVWTHRGNPQALATSLMLIPEVFMQWASRDLWSLVSDGAFYLACSNKVTSAAHVIYTALYVRTKQLSNHLLVITTLSGKTHKENKHVSRDNQIIIHWHANAFKSESEVLIWAVCQKSSLFSLRQEARSL